MFGYNDYNDLGITFFFFFLITHCSTSFFHLSNFVALKMVFYVGRKLTTKLTGIEMLALYNVGGKLTLKTSNNTIFIVFFEPTLYPYNIEFSMTLKLRFVLMLVLKLVLFELKKTSNKSIIIQTVGGFLNFFYVRFRN